MEKTGEFYPGGPCNLPLECSECGAVITENNVNNNRCTDECEVCDYCGHEKCPECGAHVHCGGCI